MVRMTMEEGPREPDISQGGWPRLLAALDGEPEAALEKLRRLRVKLLRYFSAQRCDFPDELADEAIDRVLRHFEAGHTVAHVEAYTLGTARLLRQETMRRETRQRDAAKEFQRAAAPDRESAGSECFERCLAQLSPDRRKLILNYYQGEATARIGNRKQLADELGVDAVSLRNRAMRVRRALERCVRGCMDRGVTNRSESTPTVESEGDVHD